MNITRWLISIALIFVVIASLGFVKFQQIQAAIAFGESFPEPSGSVKSTVVETVELANSYDVIGEAKAPKSLTLTTEYAGPITYVGFAPGDNVKAGQVLLRQDSSLDQANLKAAHARLKLAKAQYKRQATLLSQKRTSQPNCLKNSQKRKKKCLVLDRASKNSLKKIASLKRDSPKNPVYRNQHSAISSKRRNSPPLRKHAA